MTAEQPDQRDWLHIEQLTESHRFDEELARLLTRFQYRDDGITLTAADPRPLPNSAVEPATDGLVTVFASDASLVVVCYNDRGHRMVNPIETALTTALAETVRPGTAVPAPGGGTNEPLSEEPTPTTTPPKSRSATDATGEASDVSFGVVTPHNAQRGALDTQLPDCVTANTVEKYQGGERDIITVSATVSDPEFARQEERFLLNPRRLLVAISRSRLLTIVICSTALFEVAPADSERLDDGPVWARLFTQAVGRDAEPAWSGLLGEFIGDETGEHASVPVKVYPSTIDVDGGDR